MKKEYVVPCLKIIMTNDVITTSGEAFEPEDDYGFDIF